MLALALLASPGSTRAQTSDSDAPHDASSTDASSADASSADASSADASSTDASSTDASSTDASSTDASSTDASSTDASSTDAVLTPPPFAPASSTLIAPTPTPPAPTPTPPIAPTPPAPTLTYEQGRGFTVRFGDTFSANLQSRIQLRSSFAVYGDDGDASTAVPGPTNETQVRTARLWLRGNVLEPNIRYAIQLALGANDFEAGNSSPIFDAYLELTHLRDLNVRVGQFFVPFDRARTIREFALQSVDRAQLIRELTLDRDVGVVLQSQDLFGEGGRFGYHVGLFAGDGRNRFGAHPLGFLYVARLFVRPFGTFDDDQEGDLTRQPTARLMIGGAIAYNQSTDRPSSTTGTPLAFGTFDYLHAAGDLVFKYAGFYFLGEVLYRQSTSGRSLTRTNPMTMEDETVWSRDGWGLLAQTSYNVGPVLDLAQLEVWARYEQMEAIGPTDPRLVTTVQTRGRGLGAGVNLYFNNHALKVQLDWAHWFASTVGPGEHLVRLQLDASF
ncbi:MAG: hypothetical protein U0353_34825 [Sandaracinus sp.]